jgi:hypothetical protein
MSGQSSVAAEKRFGGKITWLGQTSERALDAPENERTVVRGG